jgi:hypothetical protein
LAAAELEPDTPQTRSPSYLLAFADVNFLPCRRAWPLLDRSVLADARHAGCHTLAKCP